MIQFPQCRGCTFGEFISTIYLQKLDVLAELERSRKVFAKETTNCTRQMAWVRSLIFTSEKQSDVYWMLNTSLKTLQNAKLDSTMFDFVPEFYIEAICSGYSALRNLFSPTVSFNDLPGIVRVCLKKHRSQACAHYVGAYQRFRK